MTQRRIYQHDFPIFLTFVTYKRRRFFHNAQYAQLLHSIIVKSCEIHGFILYNFRINEEHVHLTVRKPPGLAPTEGHSELVASAVGGGETQMARLTMDAELRNGETGFSELEAGAVGGGEPQTASLTKDEDLRNGGAGHSELEAGAVGGGELRMTHLTTDDEFTDEESARSALKAKVAGGGAPPPAMRPAAVAFLPDEELDWVTAAELGENHRHFSGLMHGVKSYFWNQVNEKYGFHGKFWDKRCYYRIVDTEKYFRNTVNYVKNNWIKHKLPSSFANYPYFYQNWNLICQYLS